MNLNACCDYNTRLGKGAVEYHLRHGRIVPNEVLLRSGTAGLKRDAIAMAHQTRAVAKSRLDAPLGTIEDDELKSEIRRAMCVQLNLEAG